MSLNDAGVYKPRAGSNADKAAQVLLKHGRQMDKHLAEAVGVTTEELHASLNVAVERKYIKRFVWAGKTYYELALLPPALIGAGQEPDAMETPAEVIAGAFDAWPIGMGAVSATCDSQEAHASPSSSASLAEPVEPSDTTQASPFACALYSDGRFVLVRGEQSFVLDADEATELMGYVMAMKG